MKRFSKAETRSAYDAGLDVRHIGWGHGVDCRLRG
jgi:hypothetical protein